MEEPETEATCWIAELWGGPSLIILPVLSGWTALEQLDESQLAGLVLLGSAASVHDPSSWRDHLIHLLQPILAGDQLLPTMGICYGHQLIAHTAGAPVTHVRQDCQKLVDISTIQVVRDSQLFTAFDRSFLAAVSHSEMVSELPAGYCLTATHSSCQIHGMQHEQLPIFSLQSHPELPYQSLVKLGYVGEEHPERGSHGEQILRRFLALCHS